MRETMAALVRAAEQERSAHGLGTEAALRCRMVSTKQTAITPMPAMPARWMPQGRQQQYPLARVTRLVEAGYKTVIGGRRLEQFWNHRHNT